MLFEGTPYGSDGTMRSKEIYMTADRAPEFARRFTEFGIAQIEFISKPYQDASGKMQINVIAHAPDLNGRSSRVQFDFADVTMLKMKEGPNATFQSVAELTIEFKDGRVCVDFHAPDKDSDFVIHARNLRCTLESRC